MSLAATKTVFLDLQVGNEIHPELGFVRSFCMRICRKTRRRGDRGEGGGDGEQKLYLQEPLLECRVPEPDLTFLTDLPGGLDYNEWLASHSGCLVFTDRLDLDVYFLQIGGIIHFRTFIVSAIGFFEHINLIYGTISEYCTPTSCPDMTGPGSR